jgi:subtilisin family serine protease
MEVWKNEKVPFFLAFLFFFMFLCSAKAQNFVQGQIMISIGDEYLPITPTTNAQGTIETGVFWIDSLNALYGVYSFKRPVDTTSVVNRGLFLLCFPDSVNAGQVLASYLLQNACVNKGSLNYIREPHVTPSDYYFPQQWGLTKMKCPDAWRYTSGTQDVVIQIIDRGTDYGHPDLVRNVWQNLGEDADGDGHTVEWSLADSAWFRDPGDINGYDDDNNGYHDDLVGFDFRYDPEDSLGGDPCVTGDDHGNKTASTAAAVTDNWLSGAEAHRVCGHQTETASGTSWFSKIMIARYWSDWDAINAIDYAINNGANVISMSWGDEYDNPDLHDKLDEAWSSGLLLVASAGNYLYDVPAYPAAYENVIAVAATDGDDVKEDYSNYGNWVDLCAPGENWSASHWKQWYCYTSWSGTSCSAPFVAGVAALVWTCDTSATNVEVRNALESTADDICSLPGNQGQPWCSPYNKLGHGRVNALEAVKVFRPIPFPPGDCTHNYVIELDDAIYILNYLFYGGPHADPVCIADTNADGRVNLSDALVILNYLFYGEPPPQDGCT